MLVLDLSTVFAVPYIGGLLSDLGAEVVKVEAPSRLDQSRSSFGASFDNQPAGDYWDRAATFQGLNRGKRSVVLDLSVPATDGTTVAPVTHRQLAEAAGTAREVVTRTLGDLMDMGLLTTGPGHIALLDPECCE